MNQLPIAVLISGSGTTLNNLIHLQQQGQLPVEFRLVMSSRVGARGLDFARKHAIPHQVVRRRDYVEPEAHREAVFALCRSHGVQLVVMGGYLEHLLIADDFENRVINIHPSLIPAFCGQGYYGLRVHQAALDYGVKLSGCTVHFVDNQFDHGPILAQRSCAVHSQDTPETLQARVFELECQLYPQVIAAIARGQVTIQGRKILVDDAV